MKDNTNTTEKNNKKKGLRTSVTLHVLVILLALYPLLHEDPEQSIDTQFAISVDFSNSVSSQSWKSQASQGSQRPENEERERVQTTPIIKEPVKSPQSENTPDSKTPPVEIEIESEIFEDETDIIATNEVPELEETEEEPEQTSTSDQTIDEPTNEVPPSNSNADSDSGSASTSPSNSQGSGDGQSNTGSGSGSSQGNDSTSGKGTGGPGTGIYDGTGQGIFGRHPVYGTMDGKLYVQKGRIAFKICINPKGKTTFVSIIQSETTIKDRSLQNKARRNMLEYIWEEDYNAAPEQCGKYTFIYD